MKKGFIYLLGLAVLTAGLVGCDRKGLDDGLSDQIVFDVGAGYTAVVGTKAVDETVHDGTTNFLGSFNVSVIGLNGTSFAPVHSNVEVSRVGSSSTYRGTMSWPKEDKQYSFYAIYPQMSLTIGSSGTTATDEALQPTISVNGAVSGEDALQDIVVAYAPYEDPGTASYKVTKSLAFKHIFARLGSVSADTNLPGTVTGLSIKMKPVLSGTYNLYAGVSGYSAATAESPTAAQVQAGWSDLPATPAEVTIFGGSSNPSDFLLVPGEYELTASWTYGSENYVVAKKVMFKPGKTTNLTVNVSLAEISFEVSVEPWAIDNQYVLFI